MKYDPEIHRRRNIRLKGYDYSREGAYFVTICTSGRECLLGIIENEAMVLNELGKIVLAVWEDLPHHIAGFIHGEFVIMPNHVHGIVILDRANLPDKLRAGLEPAPTKWPTLSEVVRQFKTFSARRINAIRDARGVPVWQRNFYEHIIRNEDDYQRIAEYVVTNPARWAEDTLHPNASVGAGSKPARLKVND